MRGFPLLNLLAVMALLAAMAWPLVLLSKDTDAPVVVAQPAAVVTPDTATLKETNCTLKLVHPVKQASLWQEGKPVYVWEMPGEERLLFAKVPLEFHRQDLEVELRLEWPESTPETAVELILEPEILEARKQTVWAEGSTEEVLTFTWD
jgi:hypothetical protein